jgi:putative DNA primase/helicase
MPTNTQQVTIPIENATLNYIIQHETRRFIDNLDPSNPPTPTEIEIDLIQQIKAQIQILNADLDSKNRMVAPKALNHSQIAELMMALYPIAKIIVSENEDDPDANVLAIYQKEGKFKGTYRYNKKDLRKIARQFKYGLNMREFEEIEEVLKDIAPQKRRTTDPDLIAVENGIFNYKTKELQPFDPELVYLSKSQVAYNEHAKNIIIHNDDDDTDWDVETWVEELSDDPEIIKSLWEIMSAIVRPHVRWDKAAWLFSTKGANGKGTLVTLMRNLVGQNSYASIPIDDFSGKNQFSLAPLLNATSVIVDENDVGTYIDKAANLKAVVTNDVITIEKKGKDRIAYQFYGFMVQCLNEFPQVKDKTNSFNRRQLFIPMNKSFEGVERKYIKTDYLFRQDVLEYVLFKVLNTNFYTLSTPEASKEILEEFKSNNDPLYDFTSIILEDLAWDVVPTDFLYDLYEAWYLKNVSKKGQIGSKIKFKREVETIIQQKFKDKWEYHKGQYRMTVTDITNPEPYIAQYKLEDWYADTTSTNVDKLSKPNLAGRRYSGVFKKKH